MDVPVQIAIRVCYMIGASALQLVAFGPFADSKVSASAFNFEGQHWGLDWRDSESLQILVVAQYPGSSLDLSFVPSSLA